MTLTKRSSKGSALSYDEMDGNFTHLGGTGTYHNDGIRIGPPCLLYTSPSPRDPM